MSPHDRLLAGIFGRSAADQAAFEVQRAADEAAARAKRADEARAMAAWAADEIPEHGPFAPALFWGEPTAVFWDGQTLMRVVRMGNDIGWTEIPADELDHLGEV